MNDWQSTYLGRSAVPHDLSGFEIEAFFTYSEAERQVIDDERRTPSLKLALALQIGFLRMTGRLLEALRVVPPALWRHLGAQFGIEGPDLASLRTMYRRRRTLFEHQDLACAVLGFHNITEAQRRALVRAINAELARTSDRARLLQFARRWLYDHKQIIPRERELRAYVAKAIRQHEATLVGEIIEAIDPALLVQWRTTVTQPTEAGVTTQSWLSAPPAKHSTRQIDQVLERIELLTSLEVDQHLVELPEAIVRRYARRLASRAPAVAARIAEPTRTIEVACFLRYCLMTSTDHLLWMVRRRVADLWRKAAEAKKVDYARLYQLLMDELSALLSDGALSAAELQQKLNTLLAVQREHRGPNRAQIIREQLMSEVRPVRALLKALAQQPWKTSAEHPLLPSLRQLNALYEHGEHALPVGSDLSLGRVWRKSLQDDDREKAFAAAEVGTLLNLRRALRNGSLWIDHSLSFRSRETLFIPATQWQQTRRARYRRLHYHIGTLAYHFWMQRMKPLRRRNGNQHLHRETLDYRNLIKRKINAYHLFIQAGLVAQGLLQYLSAAFPQMVWQSFGSWLRTIRPGIPPSELVVATALRQRLPEFLLNTPEPNLFAKFILERQDPDKIGLFRAAA